MILHSDKKTKRFVDIVPIESKAEFEILQTNIQKCVQVSGIFKEYNENFIGLGNLTSSFGLLEVMSVS